jgi:hypothetical protein
MSYIPEHCSEPMPIYLFNQHLHGSKQNKLMKKKINLNYSIFTESFLSPKMICFNTLKFGHADEGLFSRKVLSENILVYLVYCMQ